MERVLVSACLLGQPVRYHGGHEKLESKTIDKWIDEGRVVSLCPEVLGGRSVPRPPAEIIGTSGFAVLDGFAAVIDGPGTDVTLPILEGARIALEQALSQGIKVAVLRDGSPSCGRTFIYNGSFRGIKKYGQPGVTTALLQRHGITVFSECQIDQADRCLRELESDGEARSDTA